MDKPLRLCQGIVIICTHINRNVVIEIEITHKQTQFFLAYLRKLSFGGLKLIYKACNLRQHVLTLSSPRVEQKKSTGRNASSAHRYIALATILVDDRL